MDRGNETGFPRPEPSMTKFTKFKLCIPCRYTREEYQFQHAMNDSFVQTHECIAHRIRPSLEVGRKDGDDETLARKRGRHLIDGWLKRVKRHEALYEYPSSIDLDEVEEECLVTLDDEVERLYHSGNNRPRNVSAPFIAHRPEREQAHDDLPAFALYSGPPQYQGVQAAPVATMVQPIHPGSTTMPSSNTSRVKPHQATGGQEAQQRPDDDVEPVQRETNATDRTMKPKPHREDQVRPAAIQAEGRMVAISRTKSTSQETATKDEAKASSLAQHRGTDREFAATKPSASSANNANHASAKQVNRDKGSTGDHSPAKSCDDHEAADHEDSTDAPAAEQRPPRSPPASSRPASPVSPRRIAIDDRYRRARDKYYDNKKEEALDAIERKRKREEEEAVDSIERKRKRDEEADDLAKKMRRASLK